MEKPIILVTNDDGVEAPGVKALADAMSELGNVVVVTPDSFQSGMGHAITINNFLRIDKVQLHPLGAQRRAREEQYRAKRRQPQRHVRVIAAWVAR